MFFTCNNDAHYDNEDHIIIILSELPLAFNISPEPYHTLLDVNRILRTR